MYCFVCKASSHLKVRAGDSTPNSPTYDSGELGRLKSRHVVRRPRLGEISLAGGAKRVMQ